MASTKNGEGSGLDVPDTVTAPSCMPSSSADWVLGVARFTSSASRMWPKMGPRWNSKCFRPLGSSTMMLVPMMSPGIRSGVNWIRERPDEEGLAEARHALEQHMAAGKQADQHVRDDLVVPHDDLADLGAQGSERGDEVSHSPFLGLDRLGRLRHPRLLSHQVTC